VIKRAVDWLFRDRKTGRIVVFQVPNVPLIAFLVAGGVKRFAHLDGKPGTAFSAVAVLSLIWWSVDEILRGVNPFRRMLGGAVLIATAVSLTGRAL
jgi:hypothetical protein